MPTLSVLAREIGAGWRGFLGKGVIFALLFQVFMMLALIVRFQALPNYVTFYDWIGNAIRIIQSTPAWSDILPIIREIEASGVKTLRGIADALTARGVKTPTGRATWHPQQVSNIKKQGE